MHCKRQLTNNAAEAGSFYKSSTTEWAQKHPFWAIFFQNKKWKDMPVRQLLKNRQPWNDCCTAGRIDQYNWLKSVPDRTENEIVKNQRGPESTQKWDKKFLTPLPLVNSKMVTSRIMLQTPLFHQEAQFFFRKIQIYQHMKYF